MKGSGKLAKKKEITVHVSYDYVINVTDIDPEQIDVEEYAMDLTKSGIAYMINRGIITANDFDYKIKES